MPSHDFLLPTDEKLQPHDSEVARRLLKGELRQVSLRLLHVLFDVRQILECATFKKITQLIVHVQLKDLAALVLSFSHLCQLNCVLKFNTLRLK